MDKGGWAMLGFAPKCLALALHFRIALSRWRECPKVCGDWAHQHENGVSSGVGTPGTDDVDRDGPVPAAEDGVV